MHSRLLIFTNTLMLLLCTALMHAHAGPASQDTLPRTIGEAGWRISGEPYSYNPQNLYSYIDGAADLFIAYGFIKLQGAEYVDTADTKESLTADIYDMGSKLSAFGMFNSKKDPASPSLNIGAGSFGNEQYVIFYKSRFYVEVQPRIAREKNKPAPISIARKIAARIPGDDRQPRELAYFPPEHKVPDTENYVAGGILGHGFLPRGLVCDYAIGGTTVKAFIALFPSVADASAALEQYQAYVKKTGETVHAASGFGGKGFTAKEHYHGLWWWSSRDHLLLVSLTSKRLNRGR
jgi:hypothetical protein